MTIPGPEWYTSSYSKNQGQCVEIARFPALVAVRDSVRPGEEVLAFPLKEWKAFLDEMKPH